MTPRRPALPPGRPSVLLVCPVGEEIGGAEQVMLAIARALPRHGFDPFVAVMRPGPLAELARSQNIEADSFTVAHRYRDPLAVLRATLWLNRLARRTGAALLHATHTAHLYAGLTSRRLRVPEIWHCHDTPNGHDPVDLLQRRLRPAHTIFTTRRVAAGFPEMRRGPYSVIAPCRTDPDHLRQQTPRPDVRRRLGLPEGPLFLTVARLQETKGHPDLIDAATIVLRQRPDAVFAIAGSAVNAEQLAYRDGLRRQIDRLGITARVRLIGYADDAEQAALYREAVALIHPARHEGYGLVLLEAMCMGVPVIAAAAAGPAEIIQDRHNGLLVPVGNPKALSNAVTQLLTDHGLQKRLREAGLATAHVNTLDAMTAQTVEVYRQTLAALPGTHCD